MKEIRGEDTVCRLCDVGEKETLEHFIEQCGRLGEVREDFFPGMGEICEILLFTSNLEPEKCKNLVVKMWRIRESIIKQRQDVG